MNWPNYVISWMRQVGEAMKLIMNENCSILGVQIRGQKQMEQLDIIQDYI